jgi:hypothetical protein
MARNEKFVTITAKGRDKGKVFKLTEMPAMQAEKWAIRAFLALARGGIEIPEDIAQTGLQGIAMMGLKMFGSMKFEDAEPLLDEMLGCVEAVPDPANRAVTTSLFESSIEDPKTLITLRREVFGLHVDFSELAAPFASAAAASVLARSPST